MQKPPFNLPIRANGLEIENDDFSLGIITNADMNLGLACTKPLMPEEQAKEAIAYVVSATNLFGDLVKAVAPFAAYIKSPSMPIHAVIRPEEWKLITEVFEKANALQLSPAVEAALMEVAATTAETGNA